MISVPQAYDASIVIVNYNTRELLVACLESLFSVVSGISFEVWVVDNDSSDGSADMVENSFPQVHCIRNNANLGFARANNQAISQASGRYVVLLNSDTLMMPMSLETIVTFMDEHQDIGVCGGQLLNRDGTLQNSIANTPTLATELLNKSLLRRLFPKNYPGKERQIEVPIEVESVIGACMVVSRKAIKEVGALDERYFFFFEETDWCLSMKKAGWQVWFHPQARIVHLQGASANKIHIPARIEYWRSRYLFFRKHRSLVAFRFLQGGLMIRLLLSLAAQAVVVMFSADARSRFILNVTLFRWHLYGCPPSWGICGSVVGEESR
jgi:hypothetical protein